MLRGVCPGESTPCSWGHTPACTDYRPQLPMGTGCHGASMSLCESNTHKKVPELSCFTVPAGGRTCSGMLEIGRWDGDRSVPQAAVTEPHKRGFPSSRHFSLFWKLSI